MFDQAEHSDVEYMHGSRKLLLGDGRSEFFHYLCVIILNWLNIITFHYYNVVIEAEIRMNIHIMNV